MSSCPQVTELATQISLGPSISKTLGHQHGLRQQPRLLTYRCPLVATWASDSTDSCHGRAMDPDRAQTAAQGQMSLWFLVVGQAPHTCLFLTAIGFPVPPLSTVHKLLGVAFFSVCLTHTLSFLSLHYTQCCPP